MWTLGDDFSYQYAESWFRNMDKLIYRVNKDARKIEFLVGRRSSLGLFTTSLEDPMAIAQHHDAVSE